eukprot:Rhum_TRINITY_DN15038_c1_g1::Rhum_TRINITY_DN15038_c1_g1_i1::g.135376::m.135376
MVEAEDFDAAIQEELRRLQLQLEHSRKQRRKRESDKKDAAAAASAAAQAAAQAAAAAAAPPSDVMSVASAETGFSGATAATGTTATAAGQISVRKGKKTFQTGAAAARGGANDEAGSADGKPANAAELRRQRELEQQQKKEKKEEEEKARQAAQKSDPAAEKGGFIEVWEKKMMGWGQKKVFAVVRSTGISLYKGEIEGRGTTSGAISYAKDTKPLDLVPFVVEQANTRGSAQVRKSNISAAVVADNHPKACGNGKQFGINFHNGKQYEWKLFECQSVQEREEWVSFAAKFVKETK